MTTPVFVPATELRFKEGSSDKFYRTYAVDCRAFAQYGKAGTYGSWQPKEFATPEEAAAHAAKQADSKWKKGYQYTKQVTLEFAGVPSEAELDAAMQAVPASAGGAPLTTEAPVAVVDIAAPVAAVMPAALDVFSAVPFDGDPVAPRAMLAQTVDVGRTGVDSLVSSDDYIGQRKVDGDRMLVDVVNGVVSVYGRNGQAKQRDVNAGLLAPFAKLTVGRWTFDGEMLGGRTLVLFDMVTAPGMTDDADFEVRYHTLRYVVDALEVNVDEIVVLDNAVGADAKRALLDEAAAANWEGVMFRQRAARYLPGRVSTLIKHKFVREADCVVMSVNAAKESVRLGLYERTGGELVDVGNVTTIGKGTFVPGDVVEVRFLYCTDPDSPKLYQPRIVRARTDKAAGECLLDQLAGTATNKAM